MATRKKAASATTPATALKTSARAAKPPRSETAKPAARPKPASKITRWADQPFVVQHLKQARFKKGLRSYAQYRDLGIALATQGAVQAHIIRLQGPCDPQVVSIRHKHLVQFQFLYMLKGWLLGEYNGRKVRMEEGSCWIQPPGIPHTVLDYSDGCEMLELILPADFDTVEID
jgi:mannose-6-phosphate isomerase-like protein (cupin superfamily)